MSFEWSAIWSAIKSLKSIDSSVSVVKKWLGYLPSTSLNVAPELRLPDALKDQLPPDAHQNMLSYLRRFLTNINQFQATQNARLRFVDRTFTLDGAAVEEKSKFCFVVNRDKSLSFVSLYAHVGTIINEAEYKHEAFFVNANNEREIIDTEFKSVTDQMKRIELQVPGIFRSGDEVCVEFEDRIDNCMYLDWDMLIWPQSHYYGSKVEVLSGALNSDELIDRIHLLELSSKTGEIQIRDSAMVVSDDFRSAKFREVDVPITSVLVMVFKRQQGKKNR